MGREGGNHHGGARDAPSMGLLGKYPTSSAASDAPVPRATYGFPQGASTGW
jgi:hypothetical protein